MPEQEFIGKELDVDRIKAVAATTAVRKMLDDSYFSICAVKKVINLLDIDADREAVEILETIHCVDYNKMPTELILALPELLGRAFNKPAGTFAVYNKRVRLVS